MSDNKQTWRQQFVEIPPKSVKDVFFLDSKPNAFFITNNNDTDIYIGITSTPTAERFDKKLSRFDSDTFGRPTPTNRIYVFNPSDMTINITLYSASDMFDMNLLKNFKVEIQDSVLNQIQYDGIINGVKAGFEMPVKNLSSLISKIDTIVSKVSASGHKTMSSGTKSAGGAVTFNGNEVNTIINDADADLTVTFYKGSKNLGAFKLKKDESLNDMKLEFDKIEFGGSSVNARYILLGV